MDFQDINVVDVLEGHTPIPYSWEFVAIDDLEIAAGKE